jgi:hypothetical protein
MAVPYSKSIAKRLLLVLYTARVYPGFKISHVVRFEQLTESGKKTVMGKKGNGCTPVRHALKISLGFVTA